MARPGCRWSGQNSCGIPCPQMFPSANTCVFPWVLWWWGAELVGKAKAGVLNRLRVLGFSLGVKPRHSRDLCWGWFDFPCLFFFSTESLISPQLCYGVANCSGFPTQVGWWGGDSAEVVGWAWNRIFGRLRCDIQRTGGFIH